MVNHASDYGMILMDETGTIVEWSAGAEKILGWPAMDAIGQPVAMIFTPEDRSTGAPGAELDTARRCGSAADIRWHVRRDRSRFFADGVVNVVRADDGDTVLGFVKILREAYATYHDRVAEQTKELTEQRSFLAMVLEAVEDGIVVCNTQGKLTFFNRATREMHGLPEESIPPEQWAQHYQLYGPDGVTLLPIEQIPLYRALKGEQLRNAEMVIAPAEGNRRTLLVSGGPMMNESGHILGAVVSMHDISAERSMKEVREHAMMEQAKRLVAEHAANQLRLNDERLRDIGEQLRLATDAAELGIWTWEIDADRVTWENDRMWEITGISHTEKSVNVARFLNELVHPHDAERFKQAIEHSLATGGRFYFAGRFHRHSDREERWIELTGLLHPATQDRSARMIGATADITERKRVEQALEEAQSRLDAALSAGEVGTWIWDIRSDRVVADRNLAKIFRIDETVGGGVEAPLSHYLDAIHPDDLPDVRQRIRAAIEKKQAYQTSYRIRQENGNYCWVFAQGKADYDSHGTAIRLPGVVIDITRLKEAEAALRMTQERYQTLITSMDDGFCIVDVLFDAKDKPVDYRFIEVNPAFERQTGLRNAVGKTMRELAPSHEQHWFDMYGEIAKTGIPIRFENETKALQRWFDVYATRLGEPKERQVAILFHDITERKKSETDLRELAEDLSEENRRKTEFLAVLAHELRNPLAPIRTGLDLIRMSDNLPAASTNVYAMMDRQINQLVHLIDDLMDIARVNSGKVQLKKQRIELRTVVANAIESTLPSIEAAQHELEVSMPEEPLLLEADPTRLAQILANLLTNAAKYTPVGGRIQVSAFKENSEAVLAVKDNGIGIPSEALASVFDMFSQVSKNMGLAQGGLGIGLSLVKSLVQMHGGTIAASSGGEGKGSAFTIRLPLLESCAAMASSASTANSGPAGNNASRLRILIADDNIDAARMLAAMMETTGHQVDVVHDGNLAVQRAKLIKPDLVILDIGMPGLNGYEAAAAIRKQPGMDKAVLAALTGWGTEDDRVRSRNAGFDTHMTKPAGLSIIRQLLDTVLDRAGKS